MWKFFKVNGDIDFTIWIYISDNFHVWQLQFELLSILSDYLLVLNLVDFPNDYSPILSPSGQHIQRVNSIRNGQKIVTEKYTMLLTKAENRFWSILDFKFLLSSCTSI